MNQEIKYSFEKASKVAEFIAQLLRPHCTRLHIAGSIRRMRLEIGDIEIICEPIREFVPNGLFPDVGDWLIKKDFTEALMTIQEAIIKGDINGRYMQIKTASQICPGIYLDLFMPQPDDYYRMYAIRTGSREYVHQYIAGAWKRKGWAGVKDIGLRLISQCDSHKDSQGKTVYTLKKDLKEEEITKPPVWGSEGELFTWLGMDYIDPERREVNKPYEEAR